MNLLHAIHGIQVFLANGMSDDNM